MCFTKQFVRYYYANCPTTTVTTIARPENSYLDMLYNELIILFREKNVGWKGGLHIDIGKTFIVSLDLYLVQLWTFNSQWADIISAILELLQVIHKYIEYLKQVNMAMEKVHSSTTLVQDGTSNISVEIIDWCEEVNSICNELESLLKEKQYYEFVDLEPYLPTFKMDRHRFIKNIKLGVYIGTIVDERSETRNAQILVAICDIISQYFSREMQKNMLKKYSLIKIMSPVLLRQLFHDLTGDASISPNAILKELEECLQWMLVLQDPNITVDLRVNNGFKGTNFDEFWNELEAYFNELTS
ncbi:hypothetical protein C1646_773110 [Rhizophagus diaphanus]|nr:hypothetical protein C1646_773110 [Rhizophagus diaphanus] [Rhizophagus sp. MUCL 43196]